VGVVAISLVLLIASIVRKILAKKRAQYERDTAPVESIVNTD
jgi:hypothetical protein